MKIDRPWAVISNAIDIVTIFFIIPRILDQYF